MKMIALVKTVLPPATLPGASAQGSAGGGTAVSAAAINPLDELAIEEALRIKDDAPESHLTVMSLGDASAEIGLRRGLALGADHAIHMTCSEAHSWDPWSMAHALAQAMKRLDFQLVLCGGESTDGNSGLVGPYVAELLGIAHVPRVARLVGLAEREITVMRRVERGDRELIDCPLPALISVDRGINKPRQPTFQAVARARGQKIETLAWPNLESAEPKRDDARSLVEVVRLSGPKPARGRASQAVATQAAADRRLMMMKGTAPKPNGSSSSALLEGGSDAVLVDLERWLRQQGIEFRTRSNGAAEDTSRATEPE